MLKNSISFVIDCMDSIIKCDPVTIDTLTNTVGKDTNNVIVSIKRTAVVKDEIADTMFASVFTTAKERVISSLTGDKKLNVDLSNKIEVKANLIAKWNFIKDGNLVPKSSIKDTHCWIVIRIVKSITTDDVSYEADVYADSASAHRRYYEHRNNSESVPGTDGFRMSIETKKKNRVYVYLIPGWINPDGSYFKDAGMHPVNNGNTTLESVRDSYDK